MPKRALFWFWLITLLLLPTVLAVSLLAFTYDASLTDLVPIWSDEIWYWHQARSFGDVGFASGYYTVTEQPASAPFAHYHAWGLAAPMLYGLLIALPGLPLYGISLINLVLLTLALAAFVAAIRPNSLQLLGIAGLLGTFAPFIIYSSSSLLPVLQQALAIGIAAGFSLLLRQRENTPTTTRLILALGLLFAAWIRLNWGLLFIPYLLLLQLRWTLPRVLVSGVVGAVIFALIAAFYVWTSAPYPNFVSDFVASLSTDAGAAFELLWGNIQTNLLLLGKGNLLEVRLRLQVLLLAGLLLLALLYALWRRRETSIESRWYNYAVMLYILGAALALTVVLYDVKEWRDYRVLAPSLLLVGMLLIAFRRWLVLALLVTNLLILPEALNVYRIWTEWHVSEAKREEYYAWEAELQKVLTYEPGVDAWCNTLLHSHSYLFGPTSVLLAVDGGIGLSSPLDQPMSPPFRSRYLLLDQGDMERFGDDLNVRQLLIVPNGVLYANLDADCENSGTE